MKKHTKLLRIFMMVGLFTVTAVSLAFAALPANGAQDKAKNAANAVFERSPTNTYPGLLPDAIGNREDGDIKRDVKRAVERLKDVSVDVDKAVVTLSGQVVNEAEREYAIAGARKVAGVRTVQDQIQVAPAGAQTAGEYLDDAGITAAVKAKLLAEKGLASFNISVDTIDGVVTLTGDVKTHAQVETAGEVAQQVNGVKRVDNKVLVKP